jgi:hypothetical protein
MLWATFSTAVSRSMAAVYVSSIEKWLVVMN